MERDLEGKVCLVTGATGIGGATAALAAARGASVYIASLDQAASEALASELTAGGATAIGVKADMGTTDAAATVDDCVERFGRLDAVLAVAGGSGRAFGDGPIHEMTPEAWEATLSLNLDPLYRTVSESTRVMLNQAEPVGGSIVIVSSVLAFSPARGFDTHAYAAAKGAALALTTAAAARYAADGIRINAVAPGLTDTPMAQRAAADPEVQEYARRKQPLTAGFVDADDVAAATAFLWSDAARAITGQIIAVDGGWSVTDAAR